MKYKLTIPGRLDGMNELVAANRRSPYAGAYVKRDNERIVRDAIKSQYEDLKDLKPPIVLHFYWIEKEKRRDPDNIACGKKYIMDAMQPRRLRDKATEKERIEVEEDNKYVILENDNQANVRGFTDHFGIDKDNPHIEIIIEEVDEDFEF